MDVTFLKPLFERPGPFATVYLDMRRMTEDAPKVIELRWRALRRDLTDQGAPPETVEAIGRVVAEENRQRESGTLAAFAVGDRIAHHEVLPGPPRAETATFAALPHVEPLLAHRGDEVAYLVAVVDRLGGELRCVTREGRRREITVPPEDDFPVRKTKAADIYRQDRQQRAAEEVWHANAKKVAHALVAAAEECGADVVVLAGDIRARGAVRDELPEPVHSRVIDVGGAGPALEEEIARAVRRTRVERITTAVDRYERELTNRRRAVHGLPAVVAALGRSQVGCLLLEDRPDSPARLWVGPHSTDLATSAQALRERGVPEPVEDRADAALIRALAGTDGELLLVPPESLRADAEAAALLRYLD